MEAMKDHPLPTDILLHKISRSLEVKFNDGKAYVLPWEYLRVFSPSAEVRGRRGPDRILVRGKQQVALSEVRPVGHYAVKLVFDDGHKTGIYDWEYLYWLGANQQDNWNDHLRRLEEEG